MKVNRMNNLLIDKLINDGAITESFWMQFNKHESQRPLKCGTKVIRENYTNGRIGQLADK
jgi:hypothetical protein